MSKLQSFRVFLNERLTAAAVEIFGEVEKTVVKYQEENDRLRRLLEITSEVQLCRTDSLQLSVSEEEVPPEQQHCEQEWSPSLGQEDPETTQIKEEQEEVRTSQEEEQLQRLQPDVIESVFTPSCVKSECDQMDPHQEAILAEHPTLSPLKTSKLQSFRVLLNECLTASAAVEILGAVEETVAEYQEENDLLRRLLGRTPEIKLRRIDSLQLSVSEEGVPPEQQEWSPSLGQEDPEPTQIKEEQEDVRTSQQEEQLQGLVDTKDSIFTPSCVKSECDQMDPHQEAILAEHPTLSPLKTSKLQSFRVLLNECLTASAAVEILGAVEETVAEYQEENDLLWRLLGRTPEIKLRRIDSLQLSVSEEEVPPEQQHCEQEWSPSLGQEDPETIQIKEEQEEVRTSQQEEQLQGLFVTKDSIFTLSCVKSECDQEDPLQSLTLPQTQTVENRQNGSKPVNLTPFVTVTHIKGLNIPCDPPDNQNNASSHSSAVSSDTVGLNSSPPLDPSPLLEKHCSKPSTTSRRTHHCHDCGETFALKDDLQRHMTLTKKRPSECCFCSKHYNSTCKLKAHVRLCHGGKPYICPVCGKTFKYKGGLPRHMRIHKGEKPFICGDCGKSFNQKGNLTEHVLIHTGEKPFSCGDCGKSFGLKRYLTMHKLTHTGEKPFSCGDCGKSFNRKAVLTMHIRTHTGEKPFICGDCGKSFRHKGCLKIHVLTHTAEKRFSCGDCGKSFNKRGNLKVHIRTHTGEKSFSCGDCGKSFNTRGNLTRHIRTHTRDNSFRCGDCGESFNEKGHLNEHIRTHTGEKRFICGNCGKSFKHKGCLKIHILSHTGEKPYRCGDCGESFNEKGHLNEHIQTHTGENPYSCGDCGESFNQKVDLKRNIRIHTGEKSHGCSVCGKRFTQKSHLLRHVDKIHKGRIQDRN
ncbi:zinc finger protein 37-like isoform X1 [Salmo salar]|uniref:Zinc finger protein 37-like isoform X1 n=1 Tax=Salmo salar TaxID=8030 RepID=A0ABM3DFH4_SALSA|nr:zinc finger protein 37-like isoform X1 [Salmo salar]